MHKLHPLFLFFFRSFIASEGIQTLKLYWVMRTSGAEIVLRISPSRGSVRRLQTLMPTGEE